MRTATVLLVSVLVCGGGLGAADDWPQWRGPSRSGTAPGFEPPASWPETLRQVWERKVGTGDSAPVVAAGVVYAFVRDGDGEALVAVRLDDGEPLWRSTYPQPFEPLTIVGAHGAGPFSTPTVAGGRVFTYGIKEALTAWDARTGERLWQHEFNGQFKFNQPLYGNSQSPLVLDDRVLVHIGGPGGGALVAYDVADGRELWRTPTPEGPAYGSAVLVDGAGVPQVVTLTQRRLVGIAPSDGELLWEVPFQLAFDATSVTPLVFEDLVIMSGEKVPTRAYRIERGPDGFAAREAWSTDEAWMQFSSPVLAAGHLFAYSTKNKGQLVSLDPRTGELQWAGPGRSGDHAFLIAAAGYVLVAGADAEMAVVDASDDAHPVVARYTLGDSWMWSHPALAGTSLLVKDHDTLRRWEIVPDASVSP